MFFADHFRRIVRQMIILYLPVKSTPNSKVFSRMSQAVDNIIAGRPCERLEFNISIGRSRLAVIFVLEMVLIYFRDH